MSEKYKPVKGDRVRVVLEGEVPWASGDTTSFDIGKSSYVSASDVDGGIVVSVEKIEPPVEVFQPGDVVRGRGIRSLYIAIAKDGYVNLKLGTCHRGTPTQFTSEHYEKVELG